MRPWSRPRARARPRRRSRSWCARTSTPRSRSHCRSCAIRALAEDAAQETFLRAWASLDRLRDPTRRVGTVAVWHRAQRRADAGPRARAREVADDPDLVREPETDASPLSELMAREADHALSELLRRVPNRYRAPMVLHYAADQSVAEIAQCLALSESNVKKLLSRGRELLRDRAQRFKKQSPARVASRRRWRSVSSQRSGLDRRPRTPRRLAPSPPLSPRESP